MEDPLTKLGKLILSDPDEAERLVNNNSSIKLGACNHAVKNGDLPFLKWARAHDCPWGGDMFVCAVQYGNTDVLEWLLAEGCIWNSEVTRMAAQKNALEILMWLLANDCPWDENTCKNYLNDRWRSNLETFLRKGHRQFAGKNIKYFAQIAYNSN
jgi:hypothetical protein